MLLSPADSCCLSILIPTLQSWKCRNVDQKWYKNKIFMYLASYKITFIVTKCNALGSREGTRRKHKNCKELQNLQHSYQKAKKVYAHYIPQLARKKSMHWSSTSPNIICDEFQKHTTKKTVAKLCFVYKENFMTESYNFTVLCLRMSVANARF